MPDTDAARNHDATPFHIMSWSAASCSCSCRVVGTCTLTADRRSDTTQGTSPPPDRPKVEPTWSQAHRHLGRAALAGLLRFHRPALTHSRAGRASGTPVRSVTCGAAPSASKRVWHLHFEPESSVDCAVLCCVAYPTRRARGERMRVRSSIHASITRATRNQIQVIKKKSRQLAGTLRS